MTAAVYRDEGKIMMSILYKSTITSIMHFVSKNGILYGNERAGKSFLVTTPIYAFDFHFVDFEHCF